MCPSASSARASTANLPAGQRRNRWAHTPLAVSAAPPPGVGPESKSSNSPTSPAEQENKGAAEAPTPPNSLTTKAARALSGQIQSSQTGHGSAVVLQSLHAYYFACLPRAVRLRIVLRQSPLPRALALLLDMTMGTLPHLPLAWRLPSDRVDLLLPWQEFLGQARHGLSPFCLHGWPSPISK